MEPPKSAISSQPSSAVNSPLSAGPNQGLMRPPVLIYKPPGTPFNQNMPPPFNQMPHQNNMTPQMATPHRGNMNIVLRPPFQTPEQNAQVLQAMHRHQQMLQRQQMQTPRPPQQMMTPAMHQQMMIQQQQMTPVMQQQMMMQQQQQMTPIMQQQQQMMMQQRMAMLAKQNQQRPMVRPNAPGRLTKFLIVRPPSLNTYAPRVRKGLILFSDYFYYELANLRLHIPSYPAGDHSKSEKT
jgi:hypothetical protein